MIDDARAHISTLKMLRNFHYIDDKGKDEGINGVSTFICVRGTCLTFSLVRNRARELVELLGDVEKIRSERRKAKANRHKYTGTGNDGFAGGSGRYSGFGNDNVSYNNGLLNSW